MRLRLTSSARADVRNLFEYVAADSADAAANLVDRILASLNELTFYPRRGREGRVPGTRELVISRTPYIAIYRIEPGLIRVLRVRHSAQQWPPPGSP